MPSRIWFFASLVSLVSTTASAQISAPVALPGRCEYAVDQPAPPHRRVPFPDDDLFRPLLADPKEPRNAFTMRQVDVDHRAQPGGPAVPTLNEASLSAGGLVGMWGYRVSSCRGVQLNLLGGVFSQFSLDTPSNDLLNSDFIVGLQISVRTKSVSGRLRVYHQSSHLGENFIRSDPAAADVNFGFQAIDGVLSFDRAWWRVYAGAGFLLFMDDRTTSWLAHTGTELRGRPFMRGRIRPVAGLDLTSLQRGAWVITTAGSAGVEWASPAATRRFRLVVLATDGRSSFGQKAVLEMSRSVGAQLQIEF